jgi:hypothetical protein
MRVAIFISIAFLIGGCADVEKELLKKRVEQLEHQESKVINLERELNARLNEEARLDRAVKVALWCDYIIQTCPFGVVKEGREILQKTPGRVVEVGLSKIFVLLLAFGGAFWLFILGWVFSVRPRLTDLQSARAEIQSANKTAAEIIEKARDLERQQEYELASLNDQVRKTTSELQALRSDCLDERERLEGEHAAIEKKIVEGEKRLAAIVKKVQDTDRVKGAFK